METAITASRIILFILPINITVLSLMYGWCQLRLLQPLFTVGWNN